MKIETKFDVGDVAWHLDSDNKIQGSIVRIISYSWYGLKYQTDHGAGIAESNLFTTEYQAQVEKERRES